MPLAELPKGAKLTFLSFSVLISMVILDTVELTPPMARTELTILLYTYWSMYVIKQYYFLGPREEECSFNEEIKH